MVERPYCQLMRVHTNIGNRGEALPDYGTCREQPRDELGTSPLGETETLFLKILRA